MDFTEARRAVPLLEPGREAEALTLAAARHLGSGRPQEAFESADRRCRMGIPATVADILVRGLASRSCGWDLWAEEDLERAEAADPTDRLVNLARLRFTSDPATRATAARLLLENPTANLAALRVAVSELDPRIVAHFDLVDDHLTGRVFWRADLAPVLEIEGLDGRRRYDLVADPASPLAGLLGRVAFVDERVPFAVAIAHRLLDGDEVLAEGRLWPRSRRPPGAVATAVPADPAERLRVVVPVYDDFEATAACLESAIAEAGRGDGIRIVAVDDATPDPRIARLLDELAGRGAIELRRHATNLGFIGAVERGLEGVDGADVLLLNADTVLPVGAFERLAAAVHSAPDIGTATPLSNNGEYTSFPRHALAHASPSPADAARIDAVAARVNAGRVVDLPNGIGFCLYIRADCFKAVGGLTRIYRRGYYEDIEFCIRAQRHGFRNVCAASVYVVHHGTRSFKADKRGLVVRNLGLLRARFPAFEAECIAYQNADPLRAARAAIEEELPPAGRVRLIVAEAGSEVVGERVRHLIGAGSTVVVADWRRVGDRMLVRLRHPGEDLPQSLEFDLEAAGRRLADHLVRMAPTRIEVAGARLAPAELIAVVTAVGAPVDILPGDLPVAAVASLGAPSPLIATFEAWRQALGDRWDRVVPTDRMTESTIRTHLKRMGLEDRVGARPKVKPGAVVPTVVRSPTGRGDAGAPPAALGVVIARPSPEADGFVRDLALALARTAPEHPVVVLGHGVDEIGLISLGNVRISGTQGADDHRRTIAQYGVSALVLPYSSGSFALFERITAETDVPGARFDWSFGTFALKPPSLLMDPRASVRQNVSSITDWFGARLSTRSSPREK